MKFGPVSLDDAPGKILAHSVAAPGEGRAFAKGTRLSAADVAALRALGRKTVYVAEPEPGDVDEDSAAARVAAAVLAAEGSDRGSGLAPTSPSAGRVEFLAGCPGVFHVDEARLARLNEIAGIALAALPAYTPLRQGQNAAALKIIPYALPENSLCLAETILAENGPILYLQPLRPRAVFVILCGSARKRQQVIEAFAGPLRARVEALNSSVKNIAFVSSADEADWGENAFMNAIVQAARAGAGLILLAGEMNIIDPGDVAPRAILRLGGEVICTGAPLDPGSLMMLAWLGDVPILGAPGCAKGRAPCGIDQVLPRLLAGERLTRADVAAFGIGGLLEAPDQ